MQHEVLRRPRCSLCRNCRRCSMYVSKTDCFVTCACDRPLTGYFCFLLINTRYKVDMPTLPEISTTQTIPTPTKSDVPLIPAIPSLSRLFQASFQQFHSTRHLCPPVPTKSFTTPQRARPTAMRLAKYSTQNVSETSAPNASLQEIHCSYCAPHSIPQRPLVLECNTQRTA